MNEMETMRIDEELKKQKVPPNPVKTNRYSKDSGVVDIELLKLGDACGGHRLSAPECERLKKSTLSNSLIDISEGKAM
jgi:IQ motif/SEC7 domain-containing protein